MLTTGSVFTSYILTFRYTSAGPFPLVLDFSYVLIDQAGAESETATIPIQVRAPSTLPVPQPIGPFLVNENLIFAPTQTIFNLTAIGTTSAGFSILTLPQMGTLVSCSVFFGCGTTSSITAGNFITASFESSTNTYWRTFIFTPSQDLNGMDTFVFTTRTSGSNPIFYPANVQPSVTINPLNSPAIIQCGTSFTNTGDNSGLIDTCVVSDPDANGAPIIVTFSSTDNVDISANATFAANNQVTVNDNPTGPNQILELTGALSDLNAVLSNGLTVSFSSFPISIQIQTNDGGASGPDGGFSGSILTLTINPGTVTSSALSGAVAGIVFVISAAGFGTYAFLKKKELLPEEEKPWSQDEEFNETTNHPIYGETEQNPIYNI